MTLPPHADLKPLIARAVQIAADGGLPVGFLRQVLGHYKFRWSDLDKNPGFPANLVRAVKLLVGNDHPPVVTSGIIRKRDTMYLRPSDGGQLRDLAIGGGCREPEYNALRVRYHEGTHAYFDLRASDPPMAKLDGACTAYYAKAQLKDGSQASDPRLLFWEAAAGYVERRVGAYWHTLDQLTTLLDYGPVGADDVSVQAAIYDRVATERVFGYQYRGSKQVETVTPMPPQLRVFCDTVLLEGRIPSRFHSDKRLVALARKHGLPPP